MGTHTDTAGLQARFPDPGAAVALQLVKSRKYGALATLFRLDAAQYPAAVRTLLTPCPGVLDCPVRDGAVAQSGLAAAAWSVSRRDTRALKLEHVRLWGGSDRRTEMPLIPACACSYLLSEIDGTREDIEASYRATGFEPHVKTLCPAHISNELDFMAHCMANAVAGDVDSLSAARTFMIAHLFGWGVVFAAATFARAEHPVIRFAGEMLEHMLFCELGQARSTSAAYEPLASRPVSQPA